MPFINTEYPDHTTGRWKPPEVTTKSIDTTTHRWLYCTHLLRLLVLTHQSLRWSYKLDTNRHLSQSIGIWFCDEGSWEPMQMCRLAKAFSARTNDTEVAISACTWDLRADCIVQWLNVSCEPAQMCRLTSLRGSHIKWHANRHHMRFRYCDVGSCKHVQTHQSTLLAWMAHKSPYEPAPEILVLWWRLRQACANVYTHQSSLLAWMANKLPARDFLYSDEDSGENVQIHQSSLFAWMVHRIARRRLRQACENVYTHQSSLLAWMAHKSPFKPAHEIFVL